MSGLEGYWSTMNSSSYAYNVINQNRAWPTCYCTSLVCLPLDTGTPHGSVCAEQAVQFPDLVAKFPPAEACLI